MAMVGECFRDEDGEDEEIRLWDRQVSKQFSQGVCRTCRPGEVDGVRCRVVTLSSFGQGDSSPTPQSRYYVHNLSLIHISEPTRPY